MSSPNAPFRQAAEEDVLTTIDAEGRRKWMNPRLSKGRFLWRRRIVAYGLIALFTVLPFLGLNGKPLLLLDIGAGKFHILGKTFLATDSALMALLAIILFLSIFFFTAVLGRVWCGWICPQTVYMEFVFRPLERLMTGKAGIGGAPRHNSLWRKLVLWVLYTLICAILCHVFIAYFVGIDKLLGLENWFPALSADDASRGQTAWLLQNPFEHAKPFIATTVVTCAMLFDFGIWREQLCTLACPYGRFQSVLLDRHSLIVAYDEKRGEPRGKPRRAKKGVSLPVLGDCVDCKMCVHTCPTGIDIRQGLQLECLHCTQCIDACDTVMTQLNRPTGLIRYSTQAILSGEPVKKFRPRLIIYPLIMTVLATVFVLMLRSKKDLYVSPLTRPANGPAYMQQGPDKIENIFQLIMINRTNKTRHYIFSCHNVLTKLTSDSFKNGKLTLQPGEKRTIFLHITVPRIIIRGQVTYLDIIDDRGETHTLDVRLFSPSN